MKVHFIPTCLYPTLLAHRINFYFAAVLIINSTIHIQKTKINFMKKYLLIVLLIALGTAGFTQRIGIQAGPVFASQKVEIMDQDETSKSKVGLTLGVNLAVPLSTSFMFQPEINWTQKGWKDEEGGVDYSATLNYIEIPVYVLWNSGASKGEGSTGGFYLGLGPAINFAIGGKFKADDQEQDIEFGDDEANDDYSGFEFALNGTAGYMFSGFYIGTVYSYGLSNIAPGGPDNYTINNRYFGIRLGYTFGASK